MQHKKKKNLWLLRGWPLVL